MRLTGALFALAAQLFAPVIGQAVLSLALPSALGFTGLVLNAGSANL